MWPEGQLWKPGPADPAKAAALPPAGEISCLNLEGCGARLTERFSDDPGAGTPSLEKFLKIARDWLDYFGNINILSI
jgi:hypothetical protein